MDLNDKRFRIFAIGVIAVLVIVALVNIVQGSTSGQGARTISYSQFLDYVEQGKISSVLMSGRQIAGRFTDKTEFRSYAADDPQLVPTLRHKGIAISAMAAPAEGPSWTSLLTTLLPTLLLVGFAIFFMTRMPGMGGRSMGGRLDGIVWSLMAFSTGPPMSQRPG